jgi:anti-sigma-K factor RskA
MTRRADEELVAYLLGEMTRHDAAALERALASDAALRDRVERLRPVVRRLDALPGEAWELPPLPALPAVPADGRPRRAVVLRPVMAAACAVALVVVGGLLGLALGRDGDGRPTASPPAEEIRLAPVGATSAGARGTVRVDQTGAERVQLSVAGLKPLPPGRFYEMWLLGRGGGLVSLGSFRVDASGRATITVPAPADPGRFRYFDVSVEPADGNPGHSGDSVLRGPTRS